MGADIRGWGAKADRAFGLGIGLGLGPGGIEGWSPCFGGRGP
jgi:hypothetical protein